MSELEIIDLRGMELPPMGGKIYLVDRKGLFIFEDRPGTLRTIACTHAGSGSMVAIDGYPDENGNLLELPEDRTGKFGRQIYKANPIVMGSWMLDGGFHHGLTLKVSGGREKVMAMASVVWIPYRKR